jgi:hypothetical protein
MSFLNKIFKNKLTGDTFTIIDQYQNVAITSTKEKIDANLLKNDKIFMEVSGGTQPNIRESFSPRQEEIIDPNKFFSNQSTYNVFADKIKTIDTTKLKDEPIQSFTNVNESNSSINYPSNFGVAPTTNESAIIMSDPEDEIEELKRKYGATTVSDSIRQQNEVFSRILNQSEPESEPAIQRIEARPEISQMPEPQVITEQVVIPVQQQSNPVFELFKNVKRNQDFNISLKIDGKIPRLDFIEMMEDSYEHSIVEYLATEFTNNLLANPDSIKSKVIEKIKQMITPKDDSKSVVKSNIENTIIQAEKPAELTKAPRKRAIKKSTVK